MNNPYTLPRTTLIDELHNLVLRNQVVVVTGPPGTGKTSLLQLYSSQHSEWHHLRCSFLNDRDYNGKVISAFSLFENITGVTSNATLKSNSVLHSLQPGRIGFCIVIDDAQEKYQDETFWTMLIREMRMMLEAEGIYYRLVIVATRLLVTQTPSSPTSLKECPRLRSVSFSKQEAEDMMCRPHPFGLALSLRSSSALVQAIVHECDGNGAAIRISINKLNVFVGVLRNAPENALHYYFTTAMTTSFDRCFRINKDITGPIAGLQSLLVDLLSRERTLDYAMDGEDPLTSVRRANIQSLEHVAILSVTDDSIPIVKYSSPLAKRVLARHLFPFRPTITMPESLLELLKKCITNLSRQSLRSSVASEAKRPKEAVYQHLMMELLARFTPRSASILPELSSSLGSDEELDGSIDFFLNSELSYGVELMIDGSRRDEHLSRFAPGGRYAGLHSKQYFVVDFRVVDVQLRGVSNRDDLLTVFFDNDFENVRVMQGNAEIVSRTQLQS